MYPSDNPFLDEILINIRQEQTMTEDDYYDDLLGRGDGDFDADSGKYFIGTDKPVVEHTIEAKDSWFDRDNDARSPLEADLEPLESDTD